MMIKEIKYKGKVVKCEVKPDIFIIILISFTGLGMPIYFLFLKQYFLAALFHVLTLGGVVYSKGTILMNYIPITEDLRR